jgi:hypothetical protein
MKYEKIPGTLFGRRPSLVDPTNGLEPGVDKWVACERISFQEACEIMFYGGVVLYAETFLTKYTTFFCQWLSGAWYEKSFSGDESASWRRIELRDSVTQTPLSPAP